MSSLESIARMRTKVSPSGVGAYAACPQKLVFDAEQPAFEDPQWLPYSAYGTICHWYTQLKMGLNPPAPKDADLSNARRCPGIPTSADGFDAAVEACADMAISTVHAVTPLPEGVRWLAEFRVNDLKLLPGRKSRNTGEVEGFGGSIDLFRSDRQVAWDFKFVGPDKIPGVQPRRGNKVADLKNEYLWQVACYHFLSGARYAGIIWVARDASICRYILMDFHSVRGRMLATQVQRFIEFTSHANFDRLAWPVRGDHCQYCPHKPICGAWVADQAQDPSILTAIQSAAARGNDLDEMAGLTALPPAATPEAVSDSVTTLF